MVEAGGARETCKIQLFNYAPEEEGKEAEDVA